MNINSVITYFIVSIWGILIAMGVITIWAPDWLAELSNPGKNIEAISIKDMGDNFLKSEEYTKAITQYTAALKIVPDLKSAIANLAISYQKTEQFNKATIAFKHLLTLSPEYPDVIYYNLGEIYEKTNQTDKSITSFLAAAEIAAYPEKSYQKAGHLLLKQEKWEKAITNFKEAINHRQNIDNSYRGMLLKYKAAYADTTLLHQEISKMLKTDSYLSELPLYDEKIFNELLSRDIDLAKTYNNTGYCMAMIKKYKEAVPYLEIAIKINPSYNEAINNLKIVNSYLEK